jgi:hypothetical protein
LGAAKGAYDFLDMSATVNLGAGATFLFWDYGALVDFPPIAFDCVLIELVSLMLFKELFHYYIDFKWMVSAVDCILFTEGS